MNTIHAATDAARNVKAKARGIAAPVVAAVERTRYGRVGVALARFAWRHVPKWLRRTLALCLAIPGPFDEMAVAVVAAACIAGPLAVSRNARRELATAVTTAWKGTAVTATGELAARIAADPRFNEPGEAFFDQIAGRYGRDETAVAWVVARLGAPQ